MNDSTKLAKVLLLSLALTLLCAAAIVQSALPDSASGDGGTASPNSDPQTPDYGTNLWLQISNVANGKVSLILHNTVYTPTAHVYEVWSKTNLAIPGWNIETDVWAVVNQNCTPFTVPTLGRPNLFIWARDGVPPEITAQPVDQTVCVGDNATFSVGVNTNSTIPLSYQWYFNGTNPLAEATNTSLTLTNVQLTNEGVYSVVVTNVAGGVTSSNAVLTVLMPPTILSQPQSLAVCEESPASFSVSVSGTPPLYFQWQKNGTNLTDGGNISGSATANLLLSTTTTNDAGNYTVIIANACGSVTSAPPVPLTVLVRPSITQQPADQTYCQDSTASFTVNASGSEPLSYQWRRNSTNLNDGGNISGATTTNLTISDITTNDAAFYDVVVANSCGSVTSAPPATLTVLVPPLITTQPTNQTVFQGSNATFTVTATGTQPLSFQWWKNGSTLCNSNNIVSGANTSTLTLTNVKPWDAGIYTVVVSNAVGSVTSLYAVLRVWAPSSVVAWGGDGGYGFGNTNVPPGLTNVVGIAAGGYHSLALNGDGTVVGWGDWSFGQLPVPSGLTNLVAIAAGGFHSLAIKSDGRLVAWGYNLYGEADVPSGVTNVAAIAGGLHHSLVVKSDGTVVAWGYNSSGQTNVPVGLTNVVAVAGGIYHSLALKGDGTVVAWGDNTYGQTNVPSGLTNVVAIASGLYYGLALNSDGTVVAWGLDGAGDTDVPAGLANVVAITAGWYTSLALKSDGTVVVWGLGNYGQTNVPPGLTNVVGIAAGRWHCLALGNIPPVITTQPQSQTVTVGANVTFTVAASGTQPLFYQWYFYGTNLPGATTATLALNNVQTNNGGSYYVIVTNAAGGVTSSNAVLTVLMPPTILSQPQCERRLKSVAGGGPIVWHPLG